MMENPLDQMAREREAQRKQTVFRGPIQDTTVAQAMSFLDMQAPQMAQETLVQAPVEAEVKAKEKVRPEKHKGKNTSATSKKRIATATRRRSVPSR